MTQSKIPLPPTPPTGARVHHSYLYVPGDRPELMAKALHGPANALILDLEDGVAPMARDTARDAIAGFLASLDDTGRSRIAVRVHPGHLETDLAVAVAAPGTMVYLPKAEAHSLETCAALLDGLELRHGTGGTAVVALVETARGLLDAPQIATHPRVVGLALGEADLSAELGIDPHLGDEARHSLRLPLVVASAAAGLRGPTAPASTDYRDLEAFRRSCRTLRRLGFAARSAIHPAQVDVVNEVFAPTESELARARDLVARFDAAVRDGNGVMVDGDGRMVDEAVVRSARRLLG